MSNTVRQELRNNSKQVRSLMLGFDTFNYVMLDFWVVWCHKHHEGIAKNCPKYVRRVTLGCVRIDFLFRCIRVSCLYTIKQKLRKKV